MCRQKVLWWTVIKLVTLVIYSSYTKASNVALNSVCKSSTGTFSIAQPELIVAKIPEYPVPTRNTEKRITVFMNYAEEYVFECKSIGGKGLVPTIEFDPNSSRYKYNKFQVGESPDVMRRNLSTALMTNANPRLNDYNKINQTISCIVGNNSVCHVNLIVINVKPTGNCNVPPKYYTENEMSIPYKRIHDGDRDDLDCKLFGDDGDHPSLKTSDRLAPVISYSVRENDTWITCDNVGKNDTVLDSKFSTSYHTEKIRCPFRTRSIKPYLIRVETKFNEGFSVALPALGKDPKIEYSYFSVYLNDTVLREKPIPPEHTQNPYPVLVPLLASGVTAVVVIVFIILFCRWKRIKSSGSVFCLNKHDVENMENEKIAGLSKNKYDHNKYGLGKNLEGGENFLSTEGHSNPNCPGCSGLSDISGSSMITDTTSVSYCNLHRSRLISEFSEMNENESSLKDEEKVEFRKKILARQLSGDPTKINPEIALNDQARILVYNPKLEIDRANFSIGQMLGCGNFGSVYQGEATGLFHPDSKTKVAVKTANDPFDGAQRTALLCEMKILSNLGLHLNLVNMMGSCTSEFAVNRELWLLLEFCQHGDLKTYLIKHEAELSSSIKGSDANEDFDSRLLIQWAYHIARGMQYLSRKHIMHGDLAARNILLGRSQGCNGMSKLVAKISDFGLSKTFYDNINYKKQKRQYVPWKWMALEYLQTGCLTITSDVWSYGIVIWELFSLGKEPYMGKQVEDMILQLKNGYHLPCPEEVQQASTCSLNEVYDNLAAACFVAEPMKRSTFSDVVQILEAELDDEEKKEYNELTEQYASMRELMEDPVTSLKRSSTLRASASLQMLNNPTHPHSPKSPFKTRDQDSIRKDVSYLKAVKAEPELVEILNKEGIGQLKNQSDILTSDGVKHELGNVVHQTVTDDYVTLQNANGLCITTNEPEIVETLKQDIPCQVKTESDILNINAAKNEVTKDVTQDDNNGYVTLQHASDLRMKGLPNPNNSTTGYVAFEDIATINSSDEVSALTTPDVSDNIDNIQERNPVNENYFATYVSVEAANTCHNLSQSSSNHV